jgi:hypothetical protein
VRKREYKLNRLYLEKIGKREGLLYLCQWDKEHPEEHRKRCKKYYKTSKGKECFKRNTKKWLHSSKGKKWSAIHDAKRRKLGFVLLNKPFDKSVAHHVDKIHVVYIPKELHISFSHNVWTGHNMELINAKAFEYLNMDEIGKSL